MYDEKKIKEIILETKKKVKEKLENPDQKIINLSLIIDKLQIKINELYELLKIITDQEYPSVDQYLTIKEYCSFYINKETTIQTTEINNILKEDIGIVLEKEIKEISTSFAKNILKLIEIKESIEKEMDNLLKTNYINFYSIATPKIAYKMIEIAGSFEKLTNYPASTIQLLGSEKSFFKALKFNKKTPKYGILYNHPLIINLPYKYKAKFARTLASKISIGIKADINKKDISKEILEKLNNKLERLK